MPQQQTAIIIGAGPAGLTAAYELLDKTDIRPIVFEQSGDIGGISKTVNYRGNRIDIGGHRFFSKSDRVMAWWRNMLPLQGAPAIDDRLLHRNVAIAESSSYRPLRAAAAQTIAAPDPETAQEVMLLRNRLSRILFLRKFFDYPVTLSAGTIRSLGLGRTTRIGFSYLGACLHPIKNERSLEDFFINRFGRELYLTFFKDYTEKVWGVPCSAIKPEWGAQRIKGLSVTKAIAHAARNLLSGRDASLDQKKTETSLIEQFMYPKLGPGQLWEKVARDVQEAGGEVHLHRQVRRLQVDGGRVTGVEVYDTATGETQTCTADYVFSTMPVKDLIRGIGEAAPAEVREVAEGLVYRDFMTVGLLLNKLRIRNTTDIPTLNELVPDNWIYVQERDVRLGRIQIFNNWSPYMVADRSKVWMGLEYFCNEGDEHWRMPDDAFIRFAIDELAKIGVIDRADVLDHVLLRVQKAYPAYFGSYDDFDRVRAFTDTLENLYLIGRNGMHRYNNADHSMLTAMHAVENIAAGRRDKSNIWTVNTEEEYHESK